MTKWLRRYPRSPMLTIMGALIALLLMAIEGRAASVTCPNGSICLPYVNAGGTVVFNPSATISNGTGATFLT